MLRITSEKFGMGSRRAREGTREHRRGFAIARSQQVCPAWQDVRDDTGNTVRAEWELRMGPLCHAGRSQPDQRVEGD
jgi:hypothetical protein